MHSMNPRIMRWPVALHLEELKRTLVAWHDA